MKKNILKVALVAAFALFAGYSVYTSQKNTDLSALALDNIEAMAQTPGESGNQNYEIRDEKTVEIWDEKTDTYRKLTVIDCTGKGSLVC